MSVPVITPQNVGDFHGIQAQVELLYIKTANDVLGSALGRLEQALHISSDILTTLNGLQRQKNQLQVQSRTVGPFPSTESAYIAYTSGAFGSSIKPTMGSGFDGLSAANLTTKLYLQLSALAPFVDTTDPNGLYKRAQQIIDDINKSGIGRWVMDNYDQDRTNQTAGAGVYQNNLILALTAGSSLSDTQKNQVRRYLFIFEEYYKSAGAVLSKITSIIETMARNIARG